MSKKPTYLILLFLFCLNSIVCAQNKKVSKRSFSKSSTSVLSQTQEVRDKLTAAQQLFSSSPQKALDLVHDALLIAIKEDYLKEEANAYRLLGKFNFSLNEYNLSLKNYNKAIIIYNRLKLVSNQYNYAQQQLESLYYPTAKAAELAGDYRDGNLYYQQYLKNEKTPPGIVKGKIGLGDIAFQQNQLDKATNYYGEALVIENKQNNKNGIVLLNLKLGEVEKKRKNEDKAIEYFLNSQNTAIQIEDDQAVNVAYGNISDIYKDQNNLSDGIKLNQEALQYNQRRDNKTEVSNNNIELGKFYLQQDKNEEAIEYLEKGIEVADETGDIENKSKGYEELSNALKKTGREDQAVETYKEYLQLEDSISQLKQEQLALKVQRGQMLENTQNKLSLLEKDKELSEKTIELLRQEKIIQEEYIAKQRITTYSLIIGIIILLITAYLVYRSNKAKNKANQLLVLKSLRTQMNPHFIFNALNSVNSFISKNDERAANRYLSDFSRLMRDVMENSQEDFIPLTKEIDILDVYLKLEHHRFNEKFDYAFEVDKAINTEDFFIPPMLIQPYIENAVWHGLRYKKEKGFLTVSIQLKNDVVAVTIIDDGIGRKRSQELKTENQKILNSTGLKNIDSRIKIIKEVYKTNLDVQIEDSDKENQNGTKVIVTIHPKKT